MDGAVFFILSYVVCFYIVCDFSHFFFFSSRRRHTRSYGDWSSDVCSSDLAAGREPAASLVEEQCRPVRAGPVASFGQPVGEYGTQRRVEGDLADLFALAEDAKGALAGGDLDVVDVQADGLGDAGAGVERDQGEGLVARGGALLDRAQEPHRRPAAQGAWRGLGEIGAGGVRGAQAAAGVEVVDRGQGVVDGARGAFGDGLQVGAVVAYGPVPRRRRGERVAVHRGAGEPREVLAHLR